ncbi:HD domain-containing protein [Sphingobacterium sp. lm-10]|uniref:HD domain-containing protein n=1 Tax=Sphingobacterium sp. lm-10 TaxID=2944904 RepID=UPI0020213C7B|nr:HD domain-containing protein [Sphingobacterium sp. lm-10]MCL7988322.1 HD domain-containing protein [Sphingobacterium sp. lm-10]
MNKKKIINDPVYGFVTIPSAFIYDLIQHPFFQRLRYIKQGSMSHLVYPGALHTRFQHAIGAMHLMSLAISTLRNKDVEISEEEEEAALTAILLHDIGHGPFSHSLEQTIIEGVSHEMISSLLMQRLNEAFEGKLDLAICIFNDKYPRPFLHQLVSSQLDTDRMDYLNRDSFFTGVSEGVISFDRIIKMLYVVDEQLVIEQKGIYSVENFLIARRLMYWQVYLHKTVVAAEQMLLQALRRAKELAQEGISLFASPALVHFLHQRITKDNFMSDQSHLSCFTRLDDTDIMSAIKAWSTHEDKILRILCSKLMNRELFRTEMRSEAITNTEFQDMQRRAQVAFDLQDHEVDYFVYTQTIKNSAYDPLQSGIKVLAKDGTLLDITAASDLSNLDALSKIVVKYAVIYPKEIFN